MASGTWTTLGLMGLLNALSGISTFDYDLTPGDWHILPYSAGPSLDPSMNVGDFTFITNLTPNAGISTVGATVTRAEADGSVNLDSTFPQAHQATGGSLPQTIKGFALLDSTHAQVLAAADLAAPLVLTSVLQAFSLQVRITWPSWELTIDVID